MDRKSPLQKKISKIKKQSARAVMNQKTSNSIIAVNKAPRSDTKPKETLKSYHQEYFIDLFSGAKIPVTNEYIKKCAAEWLQLVRDEEILMMSTYRLRKAIPRPTWDKWLERCPELKEARDLVRDMIAERRECGGLKFKYSAPLIMKMQHLYDPEWKESEEWRAKLAPKAENNAQPIQVVLERFPDSPLVPVKKQAEE
jgi:hypothetical protein